MLSPTVEGQLHSLLNHARAGALGLPSGGDMIAAVRSATILGARGPPVSVEVHVAKGIPGFTMLGLPDESCREARDRVRAAIITSGFGWCDKKITVNLAPPSYRKTGSGLDLPIAIGLLV